MDIPRMGQLARSRHTAMHPHLWDGLKLAVFPALGYQGRTVIDWSGYSAPIAHAGTWARSNQYIGVNNFGNTGQVSLGRRILPITGAPRQYSLFAWVRRTNAGGEASVLRQFVTAEANRTSLLIGGNVRWSVGADFVSSASVSVGDVVTIGIDVAVFGLNAGNMWINGRRDRAVDGDGEASDANFEFDSATRDCDILGVCVWNGRGLRPFEHMQLAKDPFAVLRQRDFSTVGKVIGGSSAKPWLYTPSTSVVYGYAAGAA